jgi:hypothetical protein
MPIEFKIKIPINNIYFLNKVFLRKKLISITYKKLFLNFEIFDIFEIFSQKKLKNYLKNLKKNFPLFLKIQKYKFSQKSQKLKNML